MSSSCSDSGEGRSECVAGSDGEEARHSGRGDAQGAEDELGMCEGLKSALHLPLTVDRLAHNWADRRG